jgi:hypothetical protein
MRGYSSSKRAIVTGSVSPPLTKRRTPIFDYVWIPFRILIYFCGSFNILSLAKFTRTRSKNLQGNMKPLKKIPRGGFGLDSGWGTPWLPNREHHINYYQLFVSKIGCLLVFVIWSDRKVSNNVVSTNNLIVFILYFFRLPAHHSVRFLSLLDISRKAAGLYSQSWMYWIKKSRTLILIYRDFWYSQMRSCVVSFLGCTFICVLYVKYCF